MGHFNLIFVAVLLLCCGFLSTFGFVWEENTDEALFESDIRLSFRQKLALKLTGNIDDPLTALKRGIMKDKSRLWPGGVVPYNITEDLRNNTKAMVAIFDAFEEWQTQTCIEFRPWDGEVDYVEFFGTGGGCWSYVGRVGGKQRISLDNGCWQRGTVTHEIAHALGFWHEQSRPDRDNFVQIHWDNIPESKKHNFRKYNQTVIDSRGSDYDYISCMHYSATAFGGGNITISAIDASAVQLGQRIGLSPHDVTQADALYECNGAVTDTPDPTQPPPTPPNGPNDCTFESGWCGWTNVGASDLDTIVDTFDWTMRLAGTPSGNTGPTTDHTTNRFGRFVYIETSKPRVPGDIAILRSPVFVSDSSTQDTCFQFYYHMLGAHMGNLTVSITTDGSSDLQPLWVRDGNQGDVWKLGQVQLDNLDSALEYQLFFSGVRGENYQGDIAIDDLHFVDGVCS